MVTISPEAASKLRELIAEENKDNQNQETAGLRLFVQGGGCSGFQYGLMLEKEPNNTDGKFESNGIKIFVDPISINYVKGAEIDIGESGGFFVKKNPNATSTCGCGQSFNTDEDKSQ